MNVTPHTPKDMRSSTEARPDSCTTILIGSAATRDGSRIIARTEDHDPLLSKVLLKHPARTQRQSHFQANENAFRCPLPALAQAYSVFANGKIGKSAEQMTWGAAGFNQSGVGMTATETIFANPQILACDPYLPTSGITEDSITDVVLPYITSAREGAARLGELIETYGAGEGFGVAFIDRDEIWYLETGSAHQWLATRLPESRYFVTGNQGRLRAYDPDDQENYMASATLITFAQQQGFYDAERDGAFDFERVYTRHDDPHDHYYNYPRVFALQQLYTPDTARDLQRPHDFAVFEQPQAPLDVEAVKQGLRNSYQNLGRQPYAETPDYTWRPISLFRTQQSHILQSRSGLPAELADVEYISYGMPSLSVYIPCYPQAIDDFPLAYRTVTDGTAEDISAQWQFRKLQTLAMQNYTRYAPQVQQRYQQLEIHFEVLRQEMEREYLSIYRSDSLKARLLIQQFCAQACAEALTVTQELTNQLFTQLAQDVNSKYLFSGA
ncbi:C69 family dipeptidase [Edwardsiella tarda]|uniref:C69 family dipeptidase n=1 Tax=Edwardsiella tarda TaxID=636 RepID=UPI00063BF567|nr:C69 family dipeptidase [Edwardsiella tarda]AKH89122.1 C69 family dipeptidase [Edwardsiella tarda]